MILRGCEVACFVRALLLLVGRQPQEAAGLVDRGSLMAHAARDVEVGAQVKLELAAVQRERRGVHAQCEDRLVGDGCRDRGSHLVGSPVGRAVGEGPVVDLVGPVQGLEDVAGTVEVARQAPGRQDEGLVEVGLDTVRPDLTFHRDVEHVGVGVHRDLAAGGRGIHLEVGPGVAQLPGSADAQAA